MTRSCPTAGSLISSLATLNEGPLRQTAGAPAGRYSPLRRLLRGAPRLDCFGK